MEASPSGRAKIAAQGRILEISGWTPAVNCSGGGVKVSFQSLNLCFMSQSCVSLEYAREKVRRDVQRLPKCRRRRPTSPTVDDDDNDNDDLVVKRCNLFSVTGGPNGPRPPTFLQREGVEGDGVPSGGRCSIMAWHQACPTLDGLTASSSGGPNGPRTPTCLQR